MTSSTEFQEASKLQNPKCLGCGTTTNARLPDTQATFYLCTGCGGTKPQQDVIFPEEQVDA